MNKEINIKPTARLVLISQIKEKVEHKTSTGIILNPNEVEEVPTNRCEILRVGKDVTQVQEGQTCMFNLKGAYEVKHNEDTFYLIPEHEILAIYE